MRKEARRRWSTLRNNSCQSLLKLPSAPKSQTLLRSSWNFDTSGQFKKPEPLELAHLWHKDYYPLQVFPFRSTGSGSLHLSTKFGKRRWKTAESRTSWRRIGSSPGRLTSAKSIRRRRKSIVIDYICQWRQSSPFRAKGYHLWVWDTEPKSQRCKSKSTSERRSWCATRIRPQWSSG